MTVIANAFMHHYERFHLRYLQKRRRLECSG